MKKCSRKVFADDHMPTGTCVRWDLYRQPPITRQILWGANLHITPRVYTDICLIEYFLNLTLEYGNVHTEHWSCGPFWHVSQKNLYWSYVSKIDMDQNNDCRRAWASTGICVSRKLRRYFQCKTRRLWDNLLYIMKRKNIYEIFSFSPV